MADDQPICATCGKPMELEEQTDSSASWICPNGHHHYQAVSGGAIGPPRGAYELHHQSSQTTRGRPTREASQYSDFDDTSEYWEAERSLKQCQVARGTARAPNVVEDKKAELAAARRFVPEYNKMHKTSYQCPARTNEEDPPDIVAYSPTQSKPLLIEHTRVTPNRGQPYRDATYDEPGGPEQRFHEDLLKAIHQKTRKYGLKQRSEWVLLLDCFPRIPGWVIDEFVRDEAKILHNASFREIWYVDRAPSPAVRRLK